MAGYVKVGGVWQLVQQPFVKVGGDQKTVDRGLVKVAGTWEPWFERSNPETTQWFANTWGLTYRGLTNGPSNGTNRLELAYFGQGWNSQQELGMVGFNDPAGLQAAVAARPVIKSGRVHSWVGHTYSGTQTRWMGFHDQPAQPAQFSRLHTEQDASWATAQALPKPPSGAGVGVWTDLSPAVLATLETQIPAGNILGMTGTAEDSNGNPWWGWCSASSVSTSNGGGGSGGLEDISNTTDPRSMILELTLDFVAI